MWHGGQKNDELECYPKQFGVGRFIASILPSPFVCFIKWGKPIDALLTFVIVKLLSLKLQNCSCALAVLLKCKCKSCLALV